MLICLVLILTTLGFTQGSCANPIRLGLENGRVQDSQLSVSSFIGKYNYQIAARLNLQNIAGVFGGSWRADNGDKNPWIQVDFLRPVTVTGIITQGRSGSDQWVTTYKLAYSDDGITWTNDATVFRGNVDQDTLKENTLATPKTHRFFRVLPKKFYRYCSMRLEFVGCITGCRDSAPLGLENRFVHYSQITASSFENSYNKAETARLFHNKGWLRNPTDSNPWLQVDFIAKVIVDEVQTQGCGNVISWIITYKLLYSDNGYDFVEFSENGVPKVFNGNTDSSTVVGNKITATAARYFRIKPLECETDCGLRAEFIGCHQDCTSPGALGLENGIVKDIQLKATSLSSGYSQQYGRLNYNDVFSGWLHEDSDTDPWFEVNLFKDALISGVATQGGDQDIDKWMETFEMSYSINGELFLFYKFANQTKIFKANYDHSSVVKHNLPSTIYASVIRLHPKTCNLACVMRAEIYGCFDGIDNCASIACQNNGNCTDLWDAFKCECPSGYLGYFCDLACANVIDLGLGDGSISNSQFAASSVYDANYPPGNVRLDNTENFWKPSLTDDNLWVQVDFQETVNIAIIKTRGLEHLNRFIVTFSISYGNDGLTFQDHKDGARTKIFKANTDSTTTVLNYFTPNINSRYFRIHVLSFHVRAYFKMELASCIPPCTVVPAGMESTEIRDNQITASSNFDVYYRDIYARLKHTTAYWTPANSDYDNPWLQVDFVSNVIIDGIDTQGGGAASWVKTYTVSYGNDGITFGVYKQNNVEKIFMGNTDTSTVVHNVFNPRITSRFVRVNPKTRTYFISLRVELYVCSRACMPTNPCLNTGGCNSLTPTTFSCSCVTNVQGDMCETCSNPIALGLKSDAILDAQLTSSSVDSDGFNNAKFARLDQTAIAEVTSGGWAPKSDDLVNPWLQIDFRMHTTLSYLMVQGANDSTQNTRVTKFKIAYSHDGVTFWDFKSDGVVKKFITNGATNGNTIFRREFRTLLIARYVRFLPLEWNDYPVARLEMYGCTGVHLCLINPCLNSGTCLQTNDTSYQCDCVEGFSGQHCEIEQTLCTESSCSNGGSCTVENGTLVCHCPESFLGPTCETSCPEDFSLGLAYGKIAVNKFTASSQSSSEFAPKKANLNSDGWMPAAEDPNPWIMIQLNHETTVVGIATEGEAVDGDPFYTRTYTISYGINGVNFTDYMENGEVKIFIGNYNGSGIVRNDVFFSALFVRVNPKTCLGICKLKIELYSCENPCGSFHGCLNGASCSVDRKDLPYCDCLTGFFGDSCEFCRYSVSLGVENGNVSDVHFNASSEQDQLSLAKYGRLNNVYVENVTIGCWVPLSTDTEPWLQVKFNTKVTFNKVTTQGDPSSDRWVTSYEIHYSPNNGATFVVHKDIFGVINSYSGNSDRDTAVTHDITPVIYTQFIRVRPATWNSHVGLRVEFYGCRQKNYCLNNPCLNRGGCSTSNYGFSCFCRSYYSGVACQTYNPPPPPPPSSPPAAPPPSSPPAAPPPSSPPAAPPPSSPPAAPHPSSTSDPPLPSARPSSSPPPSSTTPPSTPPTSLPTTPPPPSLSSSSPPLLSSASPPPPTPGYATIAGFALNPIPPQEFGQRFSVVWLMTRGTNVTVIVSYNGLPCCNAGPLTGTGGQCDCLVTDTGLFDHHGMVNISVVALNLVSRESAHILVEVLRIITQASLTMLTSYSNFGTELEGRGSLRNVFPAEYPVKFNCSYQGGPVTNVYWTFVCDVDGTLHESQFFFNKLFPSQISQSCQIVLKLENSINSTVVLGSVELQESVILNSITSNGPVKENQTITFTISLVKLGRQTCMWVDLGDTSSLLVFGDASCATQVDVVQINPNIVSEPRMKFFFKSANTQEIVVNHVYLHPGSYHVRLNASNEVSIVTQELVAAVLPYVCHQPNVTITGLSLNTSNVLNAAQIYRSMAIALSTKQEIDCEKTGKTKTKWSIFKLDDDPRLLHMVPVSSLKKTAYHSDVPTSDLLLSGNELPYGFFEISTRVEMNGLPDVYGSDVIYIHVIQTPWLQAAVVGGSFHTAPFGLMGVLNSSASVDPDFPDTDSGMSFVWYCRDATHHEFIASNLTHEPLVSSNDPVTLPVNTSRGCFGSGRGRIDTANSSLFLDTKKMIEDKTYVILLVVSKIHPEFGLRQAMKTVFFHVQNGFPPKLDTSCSKNCQDKIIDSEKTILQSNCSAFCAGELTFGWSLYMYDDINTPQPLNLSALHEIPPKQFQEMVYNPINELDLAIKPYSLQCGKKYTLAFRAARPTGVIGELRTTLLVNSPPAGGTCNVSPLSGIALSTNFTFTCDGWTDPESPLTYEFSYGSNQTETLFYYRTIASDTPISHIDSLPIGEKSSNYTVIVKIKVKDSYGSHSVEQFIIQVLPPSNELQILTILTNSITEHFKNDDILAALSLSSALSSTLNTLGSGTSNVSDATGQKPPKEVREDILTLLSEIKSEDISAVMQVSGSLRLLVKEPDQLTSKAQDSALTITESLAGKLKNLTKEDEGFQNVKSGVTNILGSLGSLNSGSSEDSGSQNRTITAGNVNRTVDVVGQLQDILLDYLVPNEGPTGIMTETLSVNVERVTANDLGKKETTLKKCRFKPPAGAAFGIGDILSNPNNSFLQMQPVDVKLALFDKNPFTWDASSQNVTSNIIDIVVGSKHLNVSTSELTEDIAVTISRDPLQFVDTNNSFYLKPHEMNSSSKTREYTKFHCFTRLRNYTAMNFEIKPEKLGLHLNVFLKKSGKPDSRTGNYDFSYKLPDFSTCKVGNDSVYMSDELQSSSHEAVYVDPTKCAKDPYTVFVSNIDFSGTGEYCFAVQHIEQFHNETFPDPKSTFSSRNRRSVSCELGARRVRRSCVIIPPAPPKPTDPSNVKVLVADNLGFDGKYFFPNQTPNYNLTMFQSSCIFWDVVNETWKGEGCRVAVGTNREQIVCYCNHLTSFGSDLLVAPNPIDFDSVFQNFGSLAENVAVLTLISTILGFYIIGVVWARRADKRDLLMIGPTIIKKAKGTYCYLITTSTGSRQGAGTTARVVFTMTGDQNETVAIRLRDKERPCFERGQTNSFVVTYPNGVGDLSYVTIWHDNSGSSPSWYLSRLTVKDLQTGKTWQLVCENWLAVESDDGKVCRILPVANEQELTNFNHVFSKKALTGLADGHIWFSIVSRPPTSNFTRVQRLSCALCLLCCTMITSAMFYNMGGQGPSPFTVHIGSLVIDLKPFVIGLQSSIIIVPVNVLIVQIFRNLRPKKEKPQKTAVYELEKDGDGGKKKENIGRKDKDVVDGIQIENQKPSKGKLPHWFIYIAYAICYLASAASIFFTLLYSIQWGKEISTEWVIAMATSFCQSVLLLQPVKVVLAAVVFALCVKKASESEEKYGEGLVIKKPDQEQKVDNLDELEKKMQSIGKRPRKLKRYYSPPDPITLQKAREKRLKELKMNAALKEIFTFFFFLILLMDVAQYHRNPDTFLLTKTLYETFETVDAYGIDLSAISDADSLWMWSRETLIPGLYANEWYNGKKIEKGWLGNIEDYLVGIPRVRLLRVKEDSCRVSNYFKDSIPHCYSGYSVTNEEDGTFPVGWKPLSDGNSRKRRDIAGPETENEWTKYLVGGNKVEDDQVRSRYKRGLDPIMGGQSGKNRRKKKRLLASAKPRQYVVNDNALLPDGRVLSCFERWHHQTMIDLRGFPYWGTITMYSGSGYVANLGYDHVTAYTVVADLHSNGWIDVQTRAVFVEFTVYNANTNLFGILSYFIEFSPSSAVVTSAQYQVARFYLQLTGGQTLAHVLVIFFMLYFLYREGKLVYKQRLAYFKGFWNWVEVILIVCEFLLIVLFLARLYEVDRNLLQLRENPNDYVGFQYAANADALMTYVIGVLVFFYILRFLRLLRFNKNFLVIGKTLQRISSPILSFCLPFIAGFLAFGLLAFAMFGSELEDYSSIIRALVTQFSMTLGDFDFDAIFAVNPTVATLYFFSFIGLNMMVLMNIFIAIINDSFAEVQEQTTEIQNELEIIDYVTTKITHGFYETFHRGKVAPVKATKPKYKTKSKKKAAFKPTYQNKTYAELDLRVEKLDLFVDIIERSIDADKIEQKRFCSVPKQSRQDLFFRVLCLMESIIDDDEENVSDYENDESTLE